MNEREQAILIANKILDRPSADPDDDYAVLSRQFLRTLELACWQPLDTLPSRAAMGCDVMKIVVGTKGSAWTTFSYDGNRDDIPGPWTHWHPMLVVDGNIYDPRADNDD